MFKEYYVDLDLCRAVNSTQALGDCYEDFYRYTSTANIGYEFTEEYKNLMRLNNSEGKIKWYDYDDWSRKDIEAFLAQHKKYVPSLLSLHLLCLRRCGDDIRKMWLESGIYQRFQSQKRQSESTENVNDSLSLLSSLCRSILEQEERIIDLRKAVDFYHTMYPPATGQKRPQLHRSALHTIMLIMKRADELKASQSPTV